MRHDRDVFLYVVVGPFPMMVNRRCRCGFYASVDAVLNGAPFKARDSRLIFSNFKGNRITGRVSTTPPPDSRL